MSRTLVAKIAPQRSTQYAALAEALVRPELLVSPLAPLIEAIEPLSLAGQGYLRLRLQEALPALPHFATLTEWFDYFEQLADLEGPFLRPLAPQETLRFPDELVEARRYRGKTNELFTLFLLNVARWSHGGEPRWLLDPLAGGGTTLFTGLRLGLNVLGIEQDKQVVQLTDTFLKEFMRNTRTRHQREQQRRKAGTRLLYELPEAQQLVMAIGDSREAASLLEALPGAPQPDLLVTDLPYAIQHSARGPLRTLLQAALPVWHGLAAPGAVLVMAWNATTLPRERLVEWVAAGGWHPLGGGPYEMMAHRVDRVIKERDVVVARREAP